MENKENSGELKDENKAEETSSNSLSMGKMCSAWGCSETQGVHSPRLYTGTSIRENEKSPKSIKLFCLLPKSIIICNGQNPEISQNCQKTK